MKGASSQTGGHVAKIKVRSLLHTVHKKSPNGAEKVKHTKESKHILEKKTWVHSLYFHAEKSFL